VTWLSKAAVLWVLDEAPDVPARLFSTLFAVARYAGEDGRGAYPSAAAVALHTRKSESQAKRDIAELEKLGLLRRGDPRIVAGIRAGRRPHVYDLPMARGASGRTPLNGPRGAPGDRTGRIRPQNGVRPDATEEILNGSRKGVRGAPGAEAPHARRPKPRQRQCDRDGPGRHSEACRHGESRNCFVSWCECQCHPLRVTQ
jgi:Helix-turn-helix domain